MGVKRFQTRDYTMRPPWVDFFSIKETLYSIIKEIYLPFQKNVDKSI